MTIPKNIKLEQSEWEQIEVLAEHAGKSPHGYCVEVLRDHLANNPIDDATLEEIERMRAEFERRRAARLGKTRRRGGSSVDPPPKRRAQGDPRPAAA